MAELVEDPVSEGIKQTGKTIRTFSATAGDVINRVIDESSEIGEAIAKVYHSADRPFCEIDIGIITNRILEELQGTDKVYFKRGDIRFAPSIMTLMGFLFVYVAVQRIRYYQSFEGDIVPRTGQVRPGYGLAQMNIAELSAAVMPMLDMFRPPEDMWEKMAGLLAGGVPGAAAAAGKAAEGWQWPVLSALFGLGMNVGEATKGPFVEWREAYDKVRKKHG